MKTIVHGPRDWWQTYQAAKKGKIRKKDVKDVSIVLRLMGGGGGLT
jgi:hypothetical protein